MPTPSATLRERPTAAVLALGAGLDWSLWTRRFLVGLTCLWLVLVVLLPLFSLVSKSLLDQEGNFAGVDNFVRYFQTPALFHSLYNSLAVALVTTVVAVTLGFLYAYALTRSRIRGKGFFTGVAMLPIFAPTLLYGIALMYLFGRKGIVTGGFFGLGQALFGVDLGVDIGLYGMTGIILSEIIYTFPQAVLILSIALRVTDARLYEAALSLGASPWRCFFTVTLPGAKYGLLSAAFVCFILSFTDFGAPKVVGGFCNVLATDIYKQVIGQQNFVMGATVSVVLLVPTVLAFLADRLSQRRQTALLAARSVPLVPRPHPWKDRLLFSYCLAITLGIGVLFATALFASLVRVWPYDLSLGVQHYQFRLTGGGGYGAFFNSLRMAFYSAILGTAVTFVSAYLVEKGQGMRLWRQFAYFVSFVPLALPGLVVGLAFIFFFNAPSFSLAGLSVPNPLHFLYGTMGILVLSNLVHFHTVGFLSATAALKQMDKEFESVAESMAVPFHRTFLRVTVPVCLPAILEISLYFFVNAMATISAVIFLYPADTPVAAVAVANMDDAGDVAPAMAMCVLIVAANILVRMLYGFLTARVRRRTQTWSRDDA